MSLNDTLELQSQLLSQLSLNAQATYAPIIREQFYALVPAQFKYYYYNVIRRCIYWYHGYVPEVHKAAAGIFATGIGNSIVHEVSKLVIGGRVFFANKYKEASNTGNPLNPKNSTLKEFNQWSDKYAFQDTIKTWIEFAAAGGTAALCSYIDSERNLVTQAYRIDQFFHEVDFSGRVMSFTLFNGAYTAKTSNGEGRGADEVNYYILERRYYDENMKPKMKMCVHSQFGNVATGESFDLSQTTELKWENIPNRIKKMLSRDFPGIKFGIEQDINFTKDLGVFILKWTTTNRIPSVKLGESVLLNVVGYLYEYENAESYMMTDLYIGRGKVYVPEEGRNPTQQYGGAYSGFDTIVNTKLAMRNWQDQKPFSIQFELRAEEWSRTRNAISEKIASAIGVSGSDLFSYLRDISGGSKTATQIAAESQKTISYIEEKRSIIINAISPFVNLWKEFYREPDEITVRFSSQNMVNKMVTIDEIRMKKEIGTSIYDLYKELYPDYDDEQINEMVQRSIAEKKQMLEMQADIQAAALEKRMKNINGNPSGNGTVETQETKPKEEIEMKEETKPTAEGASSDGHR